MANQVLRSAGAAPAPALAGANPMREAVGGPADADAAFRRAQRFEGATVDGSVYAAGGTEDAPQFYRMTPDGRWLETVRFVPRGAEMGVSSQLLYWNETDAPHHPVVTAPDGHRYALGEGGIVLVSPDGSRRSLSPAERAALPRTVQTPLLLQAAGPTIMQPDGVNGSLFGRSAMRTSLRPPAARAPEPSACTTCAGRSVPLGAEPAVRSGPGVPSAASPPRKSSKVLDPQLRARVDALKPGEPMYLERGGKDGLLDHLSQKPNEYAVFRDANGRKYVITSGRDYTVAPKSFGDRLVFHNHPPGTPFLSGESRNGQWIGGDRGYIQGTHPEQQSTLLGTPEGVRRPRANPKPTATYSDDELDAMFSGINPP